MLGARRGDVGYFVAFPLYVLIALSIWFSCCNQSYGAKVPTTIGGSP